MEKEKLIEMLRTVYGITNEQELFAEIERMDGLDIGIFTIPRNDNSAVNE